MELRFLNCLPSVTLRLLTPVPPPRRSSPNARSISAPPCSTFTTNPLTWWMGGCSICSMKRGEDAWTHLEVVFFTNSGAEANELAMMMARLYTGCHDIISLRNAYHGNAADTMGATAQSNWKFNVIQSGVHYAVNPDHTEVSLVLKERSMRKMSKILSSLETSGNIAGFISEAIQASHSIFISSCQLFMIYVALSLLLEGVGGIIELAPGSHFWGFENHGVVPDIVTMAKVRLSLAAGIGNGIPLGAVVTTPEIAEVLIRRSYFNTFGGNPVCTCCRVSRPQSNRKGKASGQCIRCGILFERETNCTKG
ncbi:hypothetical protein V6N13_080071 [Hibiscus sabdariffa]